MVSIILLVLFVVTMFMWLLAMLGAVPNSPAYSPWLSWFACLFLGLAVFVTASSAWMK